MMTDNPNLSDNVYIPNTSQAIRGIARSGEFSYRFNAWCALSLKKKGTISTTASNAGGITDTFSLPWLL